jgi:sRNA-binding protein
LRWLRWAYPKAFVTLEVINQLGEPAPVRHPLKLGVIKEILKDPRRPPGLSTRAIQRAVAAWTQHDIYLIAVASGARRINLDGAPGEAVSREAVEAAKAALRPRRAARRKAAWERMERAALAAPEAIVRRRFAKV